MNRSVTVLLAALALCGSSPLLAQTTATPGKAPKQVVAATSTEIINLNTATAAQIATLPGIGPKTADLIVEYRQKHAPYKKVEDIL